MKITVQNEDTNFSVPIPTGLVFSDLTAVAAPKFLKQYGITITRRQALKLLRTLRKFKHSHRNWILVEVQSADGTFVEIKL